MGGQPTQSYDTLTKFTQANALQSAAAVPVVPDMHACRQQQGVHACALIIISAEASHAGAVTETFLCLRCVLRTANQAQRHAAIRATAARTDCTYSSMYLQTDDCLLEQQY